MPIYLTDELIPSDTEKRPVIERDKKLFNAGYWEGFISGFLSLLLFILLATLLSFLS